jgi:hypothetical protein
VNHGVVSPALVLMWMLRLVPHAPHEAAFPAVAEAIAVAANEDFRDPLTAAAYLVAIGWWESHFDPDATQRPGDMTRSYGPWQLADPIPPRPLPLAWQARRALVLIQDSRKRCGDLTQYASGKCGTAREVAGKRERTAKLLRAGMLPGTYLEGPLREIHKRYFPPECPD